MSKFCWQTHMNFIPENETLCPKISTTSSVTLQKEKRYFKKKECEKKKTTRTTRGKRKWM